MSNKQIYINAKGETKTIPAFVKVDAVFINSKTEKKLQIKSIDGPANTLHFSTFINLRSLPSNYLISSFIRDYYRGIFKKL